MSQVVGGDNRGTSGAPASAGTSPARRLVLVAAAAAAWMATMASVLRSEVLTRRDSPDMRALVDSARLTRTHASARWILRSGEAALGTVSSAVSGSRDEEQLAYVVEGELHAPLAARLKGVVVATWDRRPERFVFDLEVAGSRHRLDGTLADGGDVLHVRYVPPGPDAEALAWDVVDPPPLAPGPLPLPALDGGTAARSGVVDDPLGDGELAWRLSDPTQVTVAVGGRLRHGRRHEITVRGMTLGAVLDAGGLPLRLELPGGLVAELTELR